MADRQHIEEVEEQAALYSIGALPPGEAGRFEQRVASGCPLCGVKSREYSEAAAVLALSAQEAVPPPGLRARLMASIGVPAKPEAKTKTTMGEGIIVRADDGEWEPSGVVGVEFRHLYEKSTLLVRMAAKTKIPAHPHRAAEQCLVLEGSISSDDGVTAQAGDFTYMPAGSTHHELYSEEGCLLLIAYT